MSGELILVSGASGFIASHIVQQLQSLEYRVRGTVRNLKDDKKVQHLRSLCHEAKFPIELIEADLLNADSWKPAVKNCKYIIHVASPIPATLPRHEDELIRPAVEGTLNVLRAAKSENGVKRVVLTGSVASIINGFCWDAKKLYDESDWTDGNHKELSAYAKSKLLAEKAAWDFMKEFNTENEVNNANDDKFGLVVMNPSYVTGPSLGLAMSSSLEVPKRLLNDFTPMVPRIHFACIDVRDVARAHILAMDNDNAIGKRFILSSGEIWMKEIAQIYEAEFKPLGYSVSTREAPYFAMWLFSRFDTGVKQLLPSLGNKMNVDNSAMLNILNLQPKYTIKQSLLDMAHSMIENGLIEKTNKYKVASPKN